jgi:hypothetical protein
MTRKTRRLLQSFFVVLTMNIAILAALFASLEGAGARQATAPPALRPENSIGTISPEHQVILDDFVPQPNQGDSTYIYNRLGGERDALNNSQLDLGPGQLTTTLTGSWGGLTTNFKHPEAEAAFIDFSAMLPSTIRSAYQSRITGLTAKIAGGTPGLSLTLILQNHLGKEQWSTETLLTGGQQTVSTDLPPLRDIRRFQWVIEGGTAGDYAVLDSISFTATTQITDTATAAFVWSYGMLLDNWDPDTGLVRDRARFASGEFDAIQATGSLAAASAIAAQLGVVESAKARQIVETISDTLLLDTPRYHGLWPHFVKVLQPSGTIAIAPGSEWSSVDSVIAALSLLGGQGALGLNTAGSEAMLNAIDWSDLAMADGFSHGYDYNGDPILIPWDVFGGESWLVEFAHAGAGGQPSALKYPAPPTANGSGFIDELAWLTIRPPEELEYWGNNWPAYREAASYSQTLYYGTNYPGDCLDNLGLFGLSAGEVPMPWAVSPAAIYQAFGVGGRLTGADDGEQLLGAPVVVPHYAAMIAALRPSEATDMWTWLIEETPFSPLNNIESFMFPENSTCEPEEIQWNHLKGSWNLALQTLGWGNYLVQRQGQTPITWQMMLPNDFLREGYRTLAPYDLREATIPLIVK